jgi:predicted nucleic acid-binding protein
MENSEQTPKIILLDCDVISHFIANNALDDLPVIFAPHQCHVLDYVYSEVAARPMRLAFLDSLIKSGQLHKMAFPEDIEINKEFAKIKSKNPLIGDGERACMAVALFNKNVVASSNFRDVAPYCNANNILYLGTLDILSIAVTKDIYDENKCDAFIQTALQYNRANFPKGVTAMKFYTPKDLSFL